MNLEEQNVMENAARDEALLQVYPILRWFEYKHLPVPLQHISALFHELAWGQARAAWVPFNPGSDPLGVVKHEPEFAEGLRKLLEAKDCIVRARKALTE